MEKTEEEAAERSPGQVTTSTAAQQLVPRPILLHPLRPSYILEYLEETTGATNTRTRVRKAYTILTWMNERFLTG